MTTRVRQRVVFCAIVLAGLVLGVPASARADVMTMNFDLASPGGLLENDYTEAGLRMSVVDGHYDLFDGSAQIDTFAGGHSTVRFDRLGQTFDFLSFMVSLWSPRPDGLPVDELAFVTSSNGGYAQITNAGLFNFSGSAWSNVSWINLCVVDPNRSAGDTQQDNLVFDNVKYGVPEPSSILLLASGGIGALRFARRKSRKA
jgi:hypothetical protein